MKEKTKNIIVEFCAWLLIGVLVGFIIFFLSGCTTTEYITVEKVRTDTVNHSKVLRDSVWLHDSVYIKEKGDTVMIERWHTEWRERLLFDTLLIATHDTIPQPYPVIKEVEKSLSWWQRLRLYLGDGVLVFLLVVAAYYGYKAYRVFKFW